MSTLTDRYAVSGNPARHGKSPMIHAVCALAAKQDMAREVIERLAVSLT